VSRVRFRMRRRTFAREIFRRASASGAGVVSTNRCAPRANKAPRPPCYPTTDLAFQEGNLKFEISKPGRETAYRRLARKGSRKKQERGASRAPLELGLRFACFAHSLRRTLLPSEQQSRATETSRSIATVLLRASRLEVKRKIPATHAGRETRLRRRALVCVDEGEKNLWRSYAACCRPALQSQGAARTISSEDYGNARAGGGARGGLAANEDSRSNRRA